MKLSVLAVGKLKAGPERLLAGEYLTRAEGLGRKAGISKFGVAETAESQGQTAAARMSDEAHFFSATFASKAFAIALDERGAALTSAAFAGLLRRHLDGGTTELAFLIGGPDGHANSTRENAGLLLSLGPMTWPHRLVRVMLLEQIYRALTILANHPYHRS